MATRPSDSLYVSERLASRLVAGGEQALVTDMSHVVPGRAEPGGDPR